MHLNKMPRLIDLRLGCPTLSCLGVRYVGELKHLKRLSLAGSGATDASLERLQDLVRLHQLDLTDTKVTAKGIAQLKKALPKCDIKGAAEEGNLTAPVLTGLPSPTSIKVGKSPECACPPARLTNDCFILAVHAATCA